jgi:hypothetical protein
MPQNSVLSRRLAAQIFLECTIAVDQLLNALVEKILYDD